MLYHTGEAFASARREEGSQSVSFLGKKVKKSPDQGSKGADETVHLDRRYSLRMGRGHIVEEQQGSLCYEILADMLSRRGAAGKSSCYIFSRQHPNLLREKYGFDGVPAMWLATQAGESTLDPTSLGMLAHAVAEFLSNTKSGVVLVDGIEYLVTNNDFKKVARALEQINDSVMNYQGCLIMTIDPRAFDQKELAIIERNFDVIHARGAPGSGE
jgi:hypothetical protein